jgi:hypothetical protein
MNSRNVVYCSKCQQPIVTEEGCGPVCFKIPGKNEYQFFHDRFRAGDCWESYLRERPAGGNSLTKTTFIQCLNTKGGSGTLPAKVCVLNGCKDCRAA